MLDLDFSGDEKRLAEVAHARSAPEVTIDGPLGTYQEIPAEERELAEDVVLDRRPDALARLIAHFQGKTSTAAAHASSALMAKV